MPIDEIAGQLLAAIPPTEFAETLDDPQRMAAIHKLGADLAAAEARFQPKRISGVIADAMTGPGVRKTLPAIATGLTVATAIGGPAIAAELGRSDAHADLSTYVGTAAGVGTMIAIVGAVTYGINGPRTRAAWPHHHVVGAAAGMGAGIAIAMAVIAAQG